jgi:hypothetical protein
MLHFSLTQSLSNRLNGDITSCTLVTKFDSFTIYIFYPEIKYNSLEEMSVSIKGSTEAVIDEMSAVLSIAMRHTSESTKAWTKIS